MWGMLIAIWSTVVMPLMPDLTWLPAVSPSRCRINLNVGHFAGAALLLGVSSSLPRESVLEVIELPSIISHVLSYSRIVAVGLSSVAIAMVVNFMSITMFIRATARKSFTCRSYHHPVRYRRVRSRPCAEHGSGYPGWWSPLDSFALCRILHQVLQRWRQEVHPVRDETQIYGGINYGSRSSSSSSRCWNDR